MKQEENTLYAYGKHAVVEAIKSRHTGKLAIQKIVMTASYKEDTTLYNLARESGIPITIAAEKEVGSIVGHDVVHQGICAVVRASSLYQELKPVLANLREKKNPLIVLLDELQDPHNVGAIIRSAVAFGAQAIVLPEHNQAHITETAVKTSAGMVFAVPIVRVGNVNQALREMKDAGFWLYGLAGEGSTPINEAQFDSASVIVVGSEGAGIREKTLELCDFKISIPIASHCESLNASNAAAVAMYEYRKQQ